jgi:REP element-mobilizing transposase RayT
VVVVKLSGNNRRRRNSLRYPGYDYAQSGAVFVTLCTHNRQILFGAVEEGLMIHSPTGFVAIERWQAIPTRFPAVGIDAFVVMPDHLHGILFTGTTQVDATRTTAGDVIRWFKSSVHAAYVEGVRGAHWPPYEGRVWQRNFHDEIIRGEPHLERLQRYIEGNPGRWWERNQS